MFSSADSVLPEGKPVALSPREALLYLMDGATIFDVRPEYETNYRKFEKWLRVESKGFPVRFTGSLFHTITYDVK